MTSIIEQIKQKFGIEDFFTPLQQEILKIIKEHGSTQRRTFVKLLNTPRTTIYDNLLKLQKRKIIEKFSFNNEQRGRSVVYWKLKNNDLRSK